MIAYRIDPFPSDRLLRDLWQAAWGNSGPPSFEPILTRSLAHLGAFAGETLVGFVNVAGDGGLHAFVLDTTVHPDFRRRGIGMQLVTRAADVSRERKATWLHVDFEGHLALFYRRCGFEPTAAGLINLAR